MIYKEVLGGVEIRKPAMAGTPGSGNCQVTVEPGEGNIEFTLEGVVISQYENQIKRVVMETLENLDVKGVRIAIMNKDTPGYTIRTRVEGAVLRTTGQYDNLP